MSESADKTTLSQLTLLLADSLASLTVLPGSERARQITAISGRSLAGLLPNSDPATSLLRMFLGSSPPISTRCYLTWTTSDTPARRLVFRLLPSMPRTDENESSLWHTPNVPNGGRVNPVEMSETGLMPDGQKRQVGLEHQVKRVERGMWPTPTAKLKDIDTMERARHSRDALRRMKQSGNPYQIQNRGMLNPTWVEWLMVFPIGWTDLEDSETP